MEAERPDLCRESVTPAPLAIGRKATSEPRALSRSRTSIRPAPRQSATRLARPPTRSRRRGWPSRRQSLPSATAIIGKRLVQSSALRVSSRMSSPSRWTACRRAARCSKSSGDLFAHSITSSAATSSLSGTLRPSTRAAWALITSSNFVEQGGQWSGRRRGRKRAGSAEDGIYLHAQGTAVRLSVE
jgi:hypothetical protein